MWFTLALASAVFAALTSIFAKMGIDGVNSNLATAIRTTVVVVMAWGMVIITNVSAGIADISKKSWIFLILSGLATGASWLCYYRALQIGTTTSVVAVDKLSIVITLVLAALLLRERPIIRTLSIKKGQTCGLPLRLEKNLKSSPFGRSGSGEGAPSGCPLALNSRPEGVKISFS